MASGATLFGAIAERLTGSRSQALQEDDKRAASLLVSFQAAQLTKNYTVMWEPTNLSYTGHRRYPSIVMDNWAAAWKARRHFEDVTEARKAAGKTIY